MRSPLKRMLPTARHVAHDRLDRRRAAGAVAAEKADDLAFADAERDALQDVALAVVRVEVVDLKHAPSPRYAVCTAAFSRMRAGTSVAMISP